MRKTRHRITSFFLSVCMAVTCAAGMSIPAAAATDNTKKVLWDTGVAAVGDFVPHGRILAPLLNEFGKLLGIGANDGPSIGDVSKQISQLSSDIKDFREHMDKELQDLKKTMSAEIRTALDDVKTKIFMQGVGTGLDALHTQISKPGTGIADQIDSFNEGNLTEQEKMIEMASLIGGNDQWGNTSMPMATFRNMGTLLSGNPYSDEEGRNMYQVLYDNAAKKTMFTGETYDMIAPYIDRVMLEYFYDYAIVMQCLNASLYVSQITETQAKELPMAYQAKYTACFTPTATVKKAIDAITEEFLDANNPKSMISMYMVFKYKQQYDRNVYINKGTTEQAYSTTLDTYVPQLVGDKCIANRVKWFSEDQELKLFFGEFEEHMKGNLSRDDIKAINEHVRNTYPGRSFYDYLSSFGFNTNYYKNNEKAYFPVGGPTLQALSNEEAMKFIRSPYKGLYGPTGRFIYSSIDLNSAGTYRDVIVGQDGVKWYVKGWAMDGYDLWITWFDCTLLGLKPCTRSEMPTTAEAAYNYNKYKVTLSLQNPNKEYYTNPFPNSIIYSHQTSSLFNVDIKDYAGAYVSPFTNGVIECDRNVVFRSSEGINEGTDRACLYFDAAIIAFPSAGTYKFRFRVTNPDGTYSYSDWVSVKAIDKPAKTYASNVSGSYAGTVGADAELIGPYGGDTEYDYDPSNYLDIRIFDSETGEDIPYRYEALETDGITITDIGLVSFTKPGTYHIRAVTLDGSFTTDWIEINAEINRPAPIIPADAYAPVAAAVTTTTTDSDVSSEKTESKPKMQATLNDDHTVTVSWDKISGASKYILIVEKEGEDLEIASTTKTSVKINKIARNCATYKYKLKIKQYGIETDAPAAYSTILSVYYKPAVKLTAANGSITAKWKSVPDAEKYRVYKVVNGKLKLVKETDKCGMKFNGVKSGKTYTYSVAACVNGEWTTLKKSDRVSITAK